MDRIDDSVTENMLELALASAFIYKPKVALAVKEEFASLKEFFDLSGRELLSIKGVTQSHVDKIKSAEYVRRFYDEVEWCKRFGIEVVRYEDFPQRLKDIPDPPFLLFCKGNRELLYAEHSISVVGTRLAYGIDAAAHTAAISCGLKTVAVLPNGLDMIYPASHRELAGEILRKGGLIVTEFLRETKPVRVNFIKRNRIIAAISSATVVVESRVKGGAMLTAEFALGYGRELFAVPGRMDDANSYGCNRMCSRINAIGKPATDYNI